MADKIGKLKMNTTKRFLIKNNSVFYTLQLFLLYFKMIFHERIQNLQNSQTMSYAESP